MKITLPFNFPANTEGFAFWPFVFLSKETKGMDAYTLERLVAHEKVHLRQQRWFAIFGLWLPGLLLWEWLYWVGLPLGLPVGWNWLRWKWEMEAYLKGSRWTRREAVKRLRAAPYCLWWHE